jgi:signal transduction histidine kinase
VSDASAPEAHDALVRALQSERAAAQAAARWARFLARATEALASAVGFEDTLRRVGELVVPAIGDYCIVYLVEAQERGHDAADSYRQREAVRPGPTRLARAVCAATSPDVEDALEAIERRRPLTLDDPSPQARAVRLGEPVLIPEVRDGLLERIAEDEEHLALLRRAGPRSLLCVPLVAAGRVLGSLLFGLRGHEQRYGPQDLEVAQELARRVALAVDHARLYDAARAAQREAEAANRAKSDFLATMSHELRTPLSAIIGYAELLADGVVAPVVPAQEAPLSRIGASARHLLALIEDILTFARVEAGRDELRTTRVDAVELAREVAEMIEPSALQQALAFAVRAPADALPIVTDARKARQILLNLLGNAVRYTERGEVVLEVTAADDGGVVFVVRDTGLGIAPEHRARIFEPFWQVDQSHARRQGGTGLGLAVSRRLAELLGGELRIESALGSGSTFSLALPDVPPDPSSSGLAAPTE